MTWVESYRCKVVIRIGLWSLLVLLLAGCYRGEGRLPTPMVDVPPPPQLTPQPILINGSALMQPFVAALGDTYQQIAPHTSVVVSASGTRTGFAQFCAGESHLHNGLRAITEEETASCERNGIDWQAVVLAYDSAVPVVPVANAFAGCLNLAQLQSIWGADSIVQEWQQVNLQYEALPLVVYAPPADSLVNHLFGQVVLGNRPMREITAEGPPVGAEAVGLISLGDAARLGDSVRILPVAIDRDGQPNTDVQCVAASEQTVRDGSYPLARALYLYVNVDALSRPEIAGFLTFVLSAEADEVLRDYGLVPPANEVRSQTRQKLGLTS